MTVVAATTIRGFMEKEEKNNKEKTVKETKKNLLAKANVKQENKNLPQEQKNKKHYFKFRQHNNSSSVAEVLVDICQKLVKKSLLLIIFWVLLSVGILLTGSYCIFKEYFVGMAYPWWYLALIVLLLFGVYGFIGFIYGITMALLHAVLSLSSSLGDIIRKTVLRVKNSIESKVDRFADKLEQNSLLELIKKTFEDISKDIHRYAAKTAVGLLVIAFLGSVLFLVKRIVITSFKKVQNKAEFFTKMSIRFSLIIAVILNLKFFTKIALVIGYLVGILLILSQVLLWYIMQ